MKIEIDKYIIDQCPTSPTMFDLYKKQVVKSGKSEGETKLSNIGYGMPLHKAIDNIIHEELYTNQEVVTLKTFVETYVTIQKNILKQLKDNGYERT